MSSALFTFAQRVTIQLYDANSVLQGAAMTLQVTDSKPSKEMNDCDLTNSESNGFAEWAPTTVIGQFALDGVIDLAGASDLIFVTGMDGKLFAQVVLYMTKPTVAVVDPVKYTAVVLFKKFEMMGRVQANGDIWRFNAQGRVIGRFVRSGTDLTNAKVTGFVQT